MGACTNLARVFHYDPLRIGAISDEMDQDEPRLFQLLRPVPEEHLIRPGDDAEWCRDHWGTRYEITVDEETQPSFHQVTDNCVVLRFKTHSYPPLVMYEFLVVELGFSVMATFDICGGGSSLCGSWLDGDLHTHDYSKFMKPVNDMEMKQVQPGW